MARPRKQKDHQRQHRLPSIRVTAAELAQFTARVRRAGLSPTDYLREAGLKARVTIARTAKADPALLAQINRIGVNLNQLARTANGTGRIPPDLDRLCRKIEAVFMKAIGNEATDDPDHCE